MIRFDFDWSAPINQLIIILAAGLLIMQILLLYRWENVAISTARRTVRVMLNLLIWCAVMGFILKPYIFKNSTGGVGLIAGKDVPTSLVNEIADSLKTSELLSYHDLGENEFDTLVLAGQDFEPFLFSSLRRSETQLAALKWIPYNVPDQIYAPQWKGILRKGEMQIVKGNIKSSKKQVLKLRFGSLTLDSLMLSEGLNAFRLSFPVFSYGRTLTELVLDNKTLGSIRFFARPEEKLTFQFILGYPDFESRTLANWLGKNGHSVQYNTVLSKNIRSQIDINKAGEPDVVVTDPANVRSSSVKKAIAAGKSVLFINLSDPEVEIQDINSALGTHFRVGRIANGNTIMLPGRLSGQPFQFINPDYILKVEGYPAAIEKTSGKVGVSLMNETFPMALRGDSAAYRKTWNSILAYVQPASGSNIEVDAPIFRGIKKTIKLNDFENSPSILLVGKDTIFQQYSLLNGKSASAEFLSSESGWTTLSHPAGGGEPAIFVDDIATSGAHFKAAEMTDFISSYTSYQARLKEFGVGEKQLKKVKKYLPDWYWFVFLMFCFTALWVEPKLS